MSGIEVNIDAEAINAAVTQSIVDSLIGEKMKEAINDQLSPKKDTYGRVQARSAIEMVVAVEVQRILQETLRKDPYATILRTAVEAHMTEAVLGEITGAAMQAFLDKLNRN